MRVWSISLDYNIRTISPYREASKHASRAYNRSNGSAQACCRLISTLLFYASQLIYSIYIYTYKWANGFVTPAAKSYARPSHISDIISYICFVCWTTTSKRISRLTLFWWKRRLPDLLRVPPRMLAAASSTFWPSVPLRRDSSDNSATGWTWN